MTVGCAAGSQTTCERFFLLPGRHPHSGKTREQKSARQTLAENPFPMPDTLDTFYSSRCATHTIFGNGPFFSDARSGYGHAGPSPDAGEWRSDGSAEWDGAERTYYRRAGGRRCWDRLLLVHAGRRVVNSGVGSTLTASKTHRDRRRGS